MIINYLAYTLHVFALIYSVINVFFQIKYVLFLKDKRKKMSVGEELLFCWNVSLVIAEIVYTMNIFNGFDRNLLTTTGKIGGPPNLICSIQSAGVVFAVQCVAGYATMTAFQVYLSVVRGVSSRKMKDYIKFMHAYVAIPPILICITQYSLGVQMGPMGMYCWIACSEADTIINESMCWTRISQYGPLAVHCLVGVCFLVPMVNLLISHMKKSAKTNSTSGGAKKGFKKTVIFLTIYLIISATASISRIRQSISPNPETEGQIGSAELAGAIATICIITLFSSNKFYILGNKPPYVTSSSTVSDVSRQSSRKKSIR